LPLNEFKGRAGLPLLSRGSWLGAFVFCAVMCKTKGETASVSGSADVPRLVCGSAEHDFGTVREGDRPAYTFSLRNAGLAPLQINKVDPSHSCAAHHPPQRIAPGEDASLQVVCDTEERTNRLAEKLTVHSNDPQAPALVLAVTARIEPCLAFESRTVEVKAAFGRDDSQDVRLTGNLAFTAHLAVDAVEPPGPDVKIIPADDEKPEGLRITCAGLRVARVAGQVRVSTGVEKPSHLTVLYTCQVIGNLSVEPTNPYIDLRAPGPAEVVVHVSSSRPDFRLEQARVVDGRFESTFERDPNGHGYSVRVRVDGGQVPDEVRGATGTLRLVSNDPAEPQKDVPLMALGPLARVEQVLPQEESTRAGGGGNGS
jgi:hypothetical protein